MIFMGWYALKYNHQPTKQLASQLNVIYEWRGNDTCLQKYTLRNYLRKGRNAARDRLRDEETKDCYIWPRIFFTHAEILNSELNLAVAEPDHFLTRRLWAPESRTQSGFFSVRFSWPSACPMDVNTVCVYNTFNANAFSFRFPTQVIRFRCPLVYTDARNFLRSDVSKINMQYKISIRLGFW